MATRPVLGASNESGDRSVGVQPAYKSTAALDWKRRIEEAKARKLAESQRVQAMASPSFTAPRSVEVLRRSPPVTHTPHHTPSMNLSSPSGVRELVLHEPVSDGDAITAFSRESTQHFSQAIVHSRTADALSAILTDLQDPSASEEQIRAKLDSLKREHPSVHSLLCASIYHALKDTERTYLDFGAVKLSENPRILLKITNQYGEPVIQQLCNFHREQHGTESQLGQLLALQAKIQSLSLPKSTSEMTTLVETIGRSFCELDLDVFSALCEQVWNLDKDAPDVRFLGNNYGKLRVLSDPRILCSYKARNLILEQVGSLTREVHAPDVSGSKGNLPVALIHTGDSPEVAKLKKSLNQIQTFLNMLNDPACSRESLVRVFSSLEPASFAFLTESVWLACGEPGGDYQFGEHTIQRDPRILLNMKNLDGVNIVAQMQEHFTTQLQLQSQLSSLAGLRILLNEASTEPSLIQRYIAELDPDLKGKLEHAVWDRDSNHGAVSLGWGYGERAIASNPRTLLSADLLTQLEAGIRSKTAVTLETSMQAMRRELHNDPLQPADTSIAPLTRQLPEAVKSRAFRVAMVTAELQYIASQGGLAGAAYGMAKSMGDRNVTVIMPYYTRAKNALQGLKTAGKLTSDGIKEEADYQITDQAGKVHKVFSATIKERASDTTGLRCLFIEDDEQFNVDAESIYSGQDKERFARFQSYAADLSMKLYARDEIEVLHCHDSQMALVPEIIAQRYSREWMRGETPSTVFTFHNNLQGSQGVLYRGESKSDRALDALESLGIRTDRVMNSFVKGLHVAEGVTTVSERFAAEAQRATLGRDVQHEVKQATLRHKVFGIVNGNTMGWNPKTDAMLRGWKDPITGHAVDLTYGPDDDAGFIADQKQAAKVQLARYLEARNAELIREGKEPLGTIDPNKPLLVYIGRLDFFQKGLDKLPFIMQEALREGKAQIFVIGLDADEEAKEIMAEMRADSKAIGYKGAIIVEDKRGPLGIHWQQGHYNLTVMREELRAAKAAREAELSALAAGLRNTRGNIFRNAPEALDLIDKMDPLTEQEEAKLSALYTDYLKSSFKDSTHGKRSMVPGMGSVLRAATDLGCFPSSFEPCGLVQGETWIFGGDVFATDTGGFHDTVITSGPDKNGTLFPRVKIDSDWFSVDKQIRPMQVALRGAIQELIDAKASVAATTEFNERRKRVMKAASQFTWTTTPDASLSAAERYKYVYAASERRKQIRGSMFADGHLSSRHVPVR
jgi:glycogen synthase